MVSLSCFIFVFVEGTASGLGAAVAGAGRTVSSSADKRKIVGTGLPAVSCLASAECRTLKRIGPVVILVTMQFDLLADGGRILAQCLGDR